MNKKLFFVTTLMLCTLIFITLVFSTGIQAKNYNFKFNENVIKIKDDKLRLVFSSELKISEVNVNLSINGNTTTNVAMKKNGNLWIYDISNLTENDTIEYWYTYKYKSFYQNTYWLNYYL